MDELDSAIVTALQSDARTTNRELAKRLRIAPSTCLERTRALRESGVISGFHAEVSLGALDRNVEAMISASLRPQSREIIHAFRDFAMSLEETLAVYVVTGEDDLLIHVAVESTTALQDFVLDNLTKRPEIARLKTTVAFEHHRKTVVEPLGARVKARSRKR